MACKKCSSCAGSIEFLKKTSGLSGSVDMESNVLLRTSGVFATETCHLLASPQR